MYVYVVLIFKYNKNHMLISINKSQLNIRKCTSDDYWFYYNLVKRNMFLYIKKHLGGWNSKVFRKNFNSKNIKIIQYKNRRIGLYDCIPKKGFLFIQNIQLSGNFQKKGIGSLMLRLIEDEAKKRKLNSIRLNVIKDNPARDLYKRFGYKIVAYEKPFTVMEKRV